MNIHTINTQCVFEYFLTPEQQLNENSAGVRLIHLPTGLIIDSVSTKNRITNKNIAIEELEKNMGIFSETAEEMVWETQDTIAKQIKQSIRKVKKQIAHIKKHPSGDVLHDLGFIGGLESCIDELETIKDKL
jgi:hypothetical protein